MDEAEKTIRLLIELGVLTPKLANAGKYLAQRKRGAVKYPLSIEKGIEVPSEKRGGSANVGHAFDWENMSVEDSAWIDLETRETSKIKEELEEFASNTGWEFVTRAVNKHGTANNQVGHGRGTRIWRVK